MKPYFVGCIAIFLLLGSAVVNANCDAPLLIKNTYSGKLETREHLAWMRLVDQSNYDEAKKSANAEYIGEGYFNGSYDDFSKKRSDLYERVNYNRDTEEARSIVTSNSVPGAIDAWVQCIQKSNGGLYSYISKESPNSATVTVVWAPIPGLPSASNVRSTINGKELIIGDLSGQRSFIVHRDNPSDEIRGVINATAKGGAYSNDFLIPGRRKIMVEHFETEAIPNDYIDSAGKSVSMVVANTPQDGSITGNIACTPFREGYFFEVSNSNPRVVVSYAPGYWGTHLLGRLEQTPMGKQKQVCFLTQCGHSGYFTACTGRLVGDMSKQVFTEVDQ